MEEYEIRGIPKSRYYAHMVIIALLLLVWFLTIALLEAGLRRRGDEEAHLLWFAWGFFAIPLLMMASHTYVQHKKRFVITKASISCYIGERKITQLDREKMSSMGIVSFSHRGQSIFICGVPKAEIMEYWQSHRKLSKRIHVGKVPFENFLEQDESTWRLAMGTYLFRVPKENRDKVIFIQEGSSERVRKIMDLLGMPPMFTGSKFLCNPEITDAWSQTINKS